MARVLLVGPTSTAQDREVLDRLELLVRELGHEPHRLQSETAEDARSLPTAARNSIQSSDAVVAVLDGIPTDSAVTWYVATALAHRRSVLGLRSDARALQQDPGQALVAGSVQAAVAVPDWSSPDLRTRLQGFLDGVRVFAGALVRDSVPKILKEEGRELRFRQVAESEYPAVLKRKLVETSQRLEEAEWGVEQEEIADLLELLETLINLRGYDKETLRSIKEGKWRKRGGFEKGYLLEEEPKLSSR